MLDRYGDIAPTDALTYLRTNTPKTALKQWVVSLEDVDLNK